MIFVKGDRDHKMIKKIPELRKEMFIKILRKVYNFFIDDDYQ